MDDLSGLNWSSSPSAKPNPPANPPYQNKPVPLGFSPATSGRSTPLSSQNSGLYSSTPAFNSAKPKISKPSTPANDSFAGLLSSSSSPKPQAALSLQERQRQLLEEKARQAALQQKQQPTSQDAQVWDFLGQAGSGRGSSPFNAPASNRGRSPLSQSIPPPQSQSEEDILAAFRSDAKVDCSSHFPPPKQTPSPLDFDDDDPFGLQSMPRASSRPTVPVPAPNDQDDDILGMLGKPVSKAAPRATPNPPSVPPERSPKDDDIARPARTSTPRDKAIAEMVDMGFPADKSARALAQTKSGMNVQEAVSILLNQAHQEASERSKARSRPTLGEDAPVERRPSPGGRSSPAWAQNQTRGSRPSSQPRREDSRTPTGDKDVTQYASEIGSTLFKSANTLWKTGQKKVQKAVSEFSQDGDPSQPKWMRDATKRQDSPKPQDPELGVGGQSSSRSAKIDHRQEASSRMTDEAMLLEGDQGPRRKTPIPSDNLNERARAIGTRKQSPPIEDTRERPQWATNQRRIAPEPGKKPLARTTQQSVEDQPAPGYTGPGRPSRQAQLPTQATRASSSSSKVSPAPLQSNNPFMAKSSTPAPSGKSSTPIEVRARPTPRNVPNVSPAALAASAAQRSNGSEAFKRGDYSAAHVAYSNALRQIPTSHPITIVVLCNRALTNIKNGDPKAAVADADAALSVIGPSKGHGEKITMGGSDGQKDMREFFGKALLRKAEGLEHVEKWQDALNVWREAVEAGVGGAVSIQGRNRCEKALQPKTAAKPQQPRPKPRPAPTRSAMQDLGGAPATNGSEAEAVKKLREANAAAEKADDEKFALSDQVDGRLIAWKGTKSDNLRALLGSLDTILWPEAGWKKVGMNELVMPNKVKIVYMKAIAKVHPDKISQTATTEQRMISASVFSTLNEAWDKFKTDNGL